MLVLLLAKKISPFFLFLEYFIVYFLSFLLFFNIHFMIFFDDFVIIIQKDVVDDVVCKINDFIML